MIPTLSQSMTAGGIYKHRFLSDQAYINDGQSVPRFKISKIKTGFVYYVNDPLTSAGEKPTIMSLASFSALFVSAGSTPNPLGNIPQTAPEALGAETKEVAQDSSNSGSFSSPPLPITTATAPTKQKSTKKK